MILETVQIKPSIDLANQVISIEEITLGPDLFSIGREIVQRHARTVIDTKDKAIRDALIQLGWVPPSGATNPKESFQVSDTMRRHRVSDPDTSVRAANRANSFAASHCERILEALAGRELTAKEIGERAGLTVVQVARRTIDLQRDGRIEVVQASDGMGGLCDMERGGLRVWRMANR